MGRTAKLPEEIKVHQGYARVSYRGKYYHLGPAGSAEADALFVELKNAWRADPNYVPNPRGQLLVSGLTADYFEAALIPARDVNQYRRALHLLTEYSGPMAVAKFTAGTLESWLVHLGQLVDEKRDRKKYARPYLRKLLWIVRGCFRWGVKHRGVPASQWHEMLTVEVTKSMGGRGRKKVRPADDATLDAVARVLPRSLAALARVQRATGARPSEIIGLRARDIDRTGKVWRVELAEHKTDDDGDAEPRVIDFGPKAVEVLRAQWPLDLDGLFFPVEGTNRPYRVRSYRQAVVRACDALGLDRFNPYQLRHSRATEIRRSGAGLDAVAAALGQKTITIAQNYAQQCAELGAKVAAASG